MGISLKREDKEFRGGVSSAAEIERKRYGVWSKDGVGLGLETEKKGERWTKKVRGIE